MNSKNDVERLRRLRPQSKVRDEISTWWAFCESGHEPWSGPDETSYDDAKADAVAHDEDAHGGEENAVVLDDGP